MAMIVDVKDAALRLDELLAEVEIGTEVVISRNQEPVARLTKAGLPAERRPDFDASNVIAEIRKARAGIAPTTIEEILAWRDEGRR